ncbi:MAG: type VI secretion system ATPase TssH [Planctomycetota bacterium]
MDVNLKSLIAKVDTTCHKALNGAVGLSLTRTNYSTEPEHLLFQLNEDTDSDVGHIFRHYEINPAYIAKSLTTAMDRFKTGSGRPGGLAPAIIDALKGAWLISTVDFGYGRVRTGTLLLALLSDRQTGAQLSEACRDLARINLEELKAGFRNIVSGSAEELEMSPAPGMAGEGAPGTGVPSAAGMTKTPALDKFTNDLTARAKAGKIDPVLGRDSEIRQIIDILTRRRQNNPILTGEAGVGKTAVVEGFALRIAAGDVPPPIQNVSLRALDLGLLQAGAGVKGEFENRLKSVIEEVKSSPSPIILFIDEAHTMIGAGGSEGQGDAANLLKPALARGELRTIAATTWAEYKKYFEKDAALARRFQVVKVEEPSEDSAVRMMRGLVETLEKHHNVNILDEAVIASVRLSARFLSGRQLPDKSVSLLDTACARVAISQTAIPPKVEDDRRSITLLETERRILEGEMAVGANHADRIAQIDQQLEQIHKDLAALEERWEKEKALVQKIREARGKLQRYAWSKDAASAKPAKPVKETAPAEPAEPVISDAEAVTVRKELDQLLAELKTMQGETPLLQPCVDEQTIAEVISAWTGIPAGRMMANEIQTILNLKQLLGERVIGQDHALDVIAKRIQTSRANMDDPKKPIGVFLMVGTSGVGKTETAVALTELLYGGERNMISINMSEYQEAHTVSSLKGSPPGYVGYGEGGVLTEAVRRKPYSVVLLDEVEKAHPDVMELFFQVFDKGVLEDGEGREIDFKNTVIILTSNVATDTITSLCADPETRPEPEALTTTIRPELEKVFPPALLGRLVISTYYPISDEVMKRIIRLKLGKIVRRVRENHGVPLEYAEKLIDSVAERCREVSSGARNVDNILTNTLLPELSREFLSRMAEGREVGAIKVDVGDDGSFVYHFA